MAEDIKVIVVPAVISVMLFDVDLLKHQRMTKKTGTLPEYFQTPGATGKCEYISHTCLIIENFIIIFTFACSFSLSELCYYELFLLHSRITIT